MKIDEIEIRCTSTMVNHGTENIFRLRRKFFEKNAKNRRCEIATRGTPGAISVAKTQRGAHRVDTRYIETPSYTLLSWRRIRKLSPIFTYD